MPSLGIAPVPGGTPAIWSCGCRAGTGFMRLSGRGGIYPFWRLGFRQYSFSHITRVFPARRPYALARPLVSWHAIVPFTFRILSKPSDPGISSKFLPAEPGIQQGASRRSQTCQFPGGCDQPATACEPHHVVHRQDGGHTSLAGLKLYCHWHHHVVLHQMGWQRPSTRTGPAR
jgi:hypothetical protein